jgi:hypothetical protein
MATRMPKEPLMWRKPFCSETLQLVENRVDFSSGLVMRFVRESAAMSGGCKIQE